ncbi:hypothetical protein BDZ88DRAFT_422950 [Geranomyces variabilis]|nr:hypothetical protein BDZ88DRAFT_422950 [Geranomyces variabilis]
MRFGQFQNDIVALERINCYAHLPIEATDEGYDRVPDTWPEDGSISYVDVSLRYRKDLPLVLKKVSFSIAIGERIGAVRCAEMSRVMVVGGCRIDLARGRVQRS